jgi:DNA-binding winged helix-turn-helix (wHTH) protein
MIENKNPFFHRGPIRDPDYFYGRDTEVKRTLEMLSQRQSVSITGPRKVGKTSLLFHLSRREVMQEYGFDPDRHLFVYLNCEGLEELKLEDLYALILEKVAERAAELERPLTIPERPISFLNFRGSLRGLSGSGKKLRVALLLDEFEALSKKRDLREKLFPGLRALAQDHIIACLTISQRPLADCSDEYSPLFNIFVPLELGLFEEAGSRELIERSLAEVGTTFPSEVLSYILELGGGHPFFLQVVSYWALEFQSMKGAPLESADFRTLTHTVRGQVESHFEYYWKNLTSEEKYVLAALPLTQDKEVYREELESLANLCLVVKEEGQYRYFSPLFRDFVRRQKVADVLQAGPFVLALPIRRALLREESLLLSARLFNLLKYLVDHQDRVVTNEELDREVLTPPEERQEYKYVDDERLKSAIRDIRRALGDEADCIVNKWGVGYRLQIQAEE